MDDISELTVVVGAPLALAAGADLGADTDTLSDLELLDVLADLNDFADNLVAGDDKLGLPRAPAARDGVVVRAANTAALDGDGHAVILERLELVLGDLEVEVLLRVLDGVAGSLVVDGGGHLLLTWKEEGRVVGSDKSVCRFIPEVLNARSGSSARPARATLGRPSFPTVRPAAMHVTSLFLVTLGMLRMAVGA